jgi:adenylosuccinate lyase
MMVQEHALTPVLDDLGRVIREHVAAKQAAGGDAKPSMSPDAIAGYLHWGATTQNITQTGFVVNLRRAHAVCQPAAMQHVCRVGRGGAELAAETGRWWCQNG